MMKNQKPYVVLGGLLASVAMSSPQAVLACGPAKVIGVYFDRDSATQMSRLADWMADLRAKYPNHESIDISASAEPGEHSPQSLTMERARNVARVLREDLRFDGAKIYLPAQGYVKKPASAYLRQLEKSQGVRAVQLEFLPACPHECSCGSSPTPSEPKAPAQ
ncbi:hypothetical protein ACLUPT_05435 [Variovorax sp. SCN45]|jgi:hypothetical protein|uniref:hypothetical protein n=2 Tax=Comamonadaceae TaxID=80864 RepID=UPI00086EFF33|nr:hypothetical protein [Variovorax sp. SCN 67-85]MBN8756193.1 hypothetical protein [Variovorax sp.]ODU16545.1 MAG: hypothetical protein ABS94_12795 [Variovorax sp. SCN 67-85]ODV23739.1 MAG: hypothetical protein ABT25_17685 [Variovorax sp. SCN 67-20]OJZ13023.1 MAG: hypothetical protein BGP22_24520 [Variovorax sp. 67-131]